MVRDFVHSGGPAGTPLAPDRAAKPPFLLLRARGTPAEPPKHGLSSELVFESTDAETNLARFHSLQASKPRIEEVYGRALK